MSSAYTGQVFPFLGSGDPQAAATTSAYRNGAGNGINDCRNTDFGVGFIRYGDREIDVVAIVFGHPPGPPPAPVANNTTPPPEQGPLHFDTGYLTSNLPLGGSARLVVDRRGDFTLTTHAHDSGFSNISYVMGVVLMARNGKAAFGIPVQGHVEGTSAGVPFDTPDRNDDKTIVGNDPRITQHFDDIVPGATLLGRLDGVDKLRGGVEEALNSALQEGAKAFGHEFGLMLLHGAPATGG